MTVASGGIEAGQVFVQADCAEALTTATTATSLVGQTAILCTEPHIEWQGTSMRKLDKWSGDLHSAGLGAWMHLDHAKLLSNIFCDTKQTVSSCRLHRMSYRPGCDYDHMII